MLFYLIVEGADVIHIEIVYETPKSVGVGRESKCWTHISASSLVNKAWQIPHVLNKQNGDYFIVISGWQTYTRWMVYKPTGAKARKKNTAGHKIHKKIPQNQQSNDYKAMKHCLHSKQLSKNRKYRVHCEGKQFVGARILMATKTKLNWQLEERYKRKSKSISVFGGEWIESRCWDRWADGRNGICVCVAVCFWLPVAKNVPKLFDLLLALYQFMTHHRFPYFCVFHFYLFFVVYDLNYVMSNMKRFLFPVEPLSSESAKSQCGRDFVGIQVKITVSGCWRDGLDGRFHKCL